MDPNYQLEPSQINLHAVPAKDAAPMPRNSLTLLFQKSIADLRTIERSLENDIIVSLPELQQSEEKYRADVDNPEVQAHYLACKSKIQDLQALVNVFKPLKNLDDTSSENEVFQEVLQAQTRLKKLFKDPNAIPEQEKRCREIYDKVQNVLDNIKKSLNTNLHGRVSNEAAEIGRASTVANTAKAALTKQNRTVTSNTSSAQKVILLDDQEAVFKVSNSRAGYEQYLADSLLNLMSLSGSATVGKVKMDPIKKQEVSNQRMRKMEEVGYRPEQLNMAGYTKISAKFSPIEQVIWERYTDKLKQSESSDSANNYRKVSTDKWWIQMPNSENWEQVSFQKLESLDSSDRLPLGALVGPTPEMSQPVSEHIEKGSNLFQAIDYHRNKKIIPPNTLVMPHIEDEASEALFEKCKLYQWSYENTEGKRINTDFKTLCLRYLNGQTINNVQSSHKTMPSISYQEFVQLQNDVSWIVIGQEVMEKTKKGEIIPLEKVEVKPLEKMLLMRDLRVNDRNLILAKLTPNSIFDAVSTAVVQLTDLHPHNLGVTIASTPLTERYKNTNFVSSDDGRQFTFLELAHIRVSNSLPLGAKINFTDHVINDNGELEEILISKTIGECPELLEALDSAWELVIFDTDLCLAESNKLSIMNLYGIDQFFIPFRSVLLETGFKDTPLPDAVVNNLLDNTSRDAAVKAFVKKWDSSPIYQRLTQDEKERVSQLVDALISDASVSDLRRSKQGDTLIDILPQVIKEMAESGDERVNNFFVELQKVFPKQVKDQHKHVFSDDPAQRISGRKQLLLELFPRISLNQQNALFEREASLHNYLTGYQALAASKLQGEDLTQEIEQFLDKATTPLTSIERTDFKAQLNADRQHPEQVFAAVCTRCIPTYFNVTRALYPLLADSYALVNSLAYLPNSAGVNDVMTPQLAGHTVGSWRTPLGKIIAEAKMQLAPFYPEYPLIASIEGAIEQAKIDDSASFDMSVGDPPPPPKLEGPALPSIPQLSGEAAFLSPLSGSSVVPPNLQAGPLPPMPELPEGWNQDGSVI